jgi:hypothetical protein
MSLVWKRVAERADNAAFDTSEVVSVLVPALKQDCNLELRQEILEGVRSVVDQSVGSLFKEDSARALENLREHAAPGLEGSFLDNVIQLSCEKELEFNDLASAMSLALSDRANRRARQIEEHYLRKTATPRAVNVRTRLEQGTLLSPIAALGREILKLEPRHTEKAEIRLRGLDDGARL